MGAAGGSRKNTVLAALFGLLAAVIFNECTRPLPPLIPRGAHYAVLRGGLKTRFVAMGGSIILRNVRSAPKLRPVFWHEDASKPLNFDRPAGGLPPIKNMTVSEFFAGSQNLAHYVNFGLGALESDLARKQIGNEARAVLGSAFNELEFKLCPSNESFKASIWMSSPGVITQPTRPGAPS